MGVKIMIMGESGTGKSTSIRNLDPNTTAIVNPVGKPLPFRGAKNYSTLNNVTDSKQIIEAFNTWASEGKKVIIVDDFQYILSVPYMNRIKETGWDKWNDFGANYYEIIDACDRLPKDVIVYFMTHTETLESGITTIKLIGKMLREKITIEGLFTIVLKTGVSEGKYYFYTQNNGKDTVKSPMGMFNAYAIDNDLSYVDSKVRNYYEFDDAPSDSKIAELDNEKSAPEVEAPAPRRRRSAASAPSETSTTESAPARTRVSRNELAKAEAEAYMNKRDEAFNAVADGREEIPFDEVTAAMEELPFNNDHMVKDTPTRRTRKPREE